jgi:hypothetical protein
MYILRLLIFRSQKSRKMIWARQILRMAELKTAYTTSVGKSQATESCGIVRRRC